LNAQKPLTPSQALRMYALARDDHGHYMRELAFCNWTRETVFPQAVVRWIEAIGLRKESQA
jgi:hypothetical protein